MTTTLKAVYEHGTLRLLKPVTLAEGAHVELVLIDRDIHKHTVKKKDPRTPAEIMADIAKLAVHYDHVETSSRDHDQILYGENGAR